MKHLYLSTACLHGEHDKCRITCKYCGTPCICPAPDCHREAPVEDEPVAEVIAAFQRGQEQTTEKGVA